MHPQRTDRLQRSHVNRFLIVYLAVVWGAMILRVDRFPLTWAPMYSSYKYSPRFEARVIDSDDLETGFLVTRANGSQDHVDKHDLNVPKWNMYRLYHRRVHNQAPAKYTDGNKNLGALNRWVRGLEEGEERFQKDWQRALIWSVNRTLSLEPGDPEFIVRIEADETRLQWDSSTMELIKEYQRIADIRCDEACLAMWEHDES